MTADFNRPGLGLETAACAAHTDCGGNRNVIIVDFQGAGYPQPAAIGAGALLAVKGKQSRVKGFQADTAGRAGA